MLVVQAGDCISDLIFHSRLKPCDAVTAVHLPNRPLISSNALLITGYAEYAAVGNGHLEPGIELLTKPFTMEALVFKVNAMLRT